MLQFTPLWEQGGHESKFMVKLFEKSICESICRLLGRGEAFVLASILSHLGSTPRTSGTKMIVRKNASIIGTIGGGLVEAEVIKAATGIFDTRIPQLKGFDLTSTNTASSMDMICGGRMRVLLELIEPTALNQELFSTQLEGIAQGKKMLMAVALPKSPAPPRSILRCLISADGSVIGNGEIEDGVLLEIWGKAGKVRTPTLLNLSGQRYLVEPIFTPGTVFLFGGGHVSREVALQTTRVGFRTLVFDDRKEFANRKRFGFVTDVRVSEGFENVFSDVEVDSDSYVVIVTRGHVHDKTVLAQALKTPAGYIGMIGSRTKRDATYKALLEEGFSQHDINRIYSPIGLSIGAETPEEIAISIVSELIKVRAEKMYSNHTEAPLEEERFRQAVNL